VRALCEVGDEGPQPRVGRALDRPLTRRRVLSTEAGDMLESTPASRTDVHTRASARTAPRRPPAYFACPVAGTLALISAKQFLITLMCVTGGGAEHSDAARHRTVALGRDVVAPRRRTREHQATAGDPCAATGPGSGGRRVGRRTRCRARAPREASARGPCRRPPILRSRRPCSPQPVEPRQ